MEHCPPAEDASAPPEAIAKGTGRITIPATMRDELFAHLLSALPNEGVGLIGVAAAAPDRAITFYPGTNVDSAPNRYTMDPAEVLAATRAMAAAGLKLGAIVHSHPDSPPTPSATDRREAYYDDVVMVIVQCLPAPPVMRAWRVNRQVVAAEVDEVDIFVEQVDGSVIR